MEPTREFIEQLEREKLMRARDMTPDERLAECFELMQSTFEIAKDGIRSQFPDVEEAEVLRIFFDRIRLFQRYEHAA